MIFSTVWTQRDAWAPVLGAIDSGFGTSSNIIEAKESLGKGLNQQNNSDLMLFTCEFCFPFRQ